MCYKLYRINDNKFIFMGKECNMKETIHRMFMYGIDQNEIEYCISDMCSKDTHVGHFGINRMFIYSSKLAA